MNPKTLPNRFGRIALCVLLSAAFWSAVIPRVAAQTISLVEPRLVANKEAAFKLTNSVSGNFLIETSSNLVDWEGLVTLSSIGSVQQTDSAAVYLDHRFYRAASVPGTNVLTGDHLATANGDLVIHPINHASLVLGWNGKTIYNDPVGGSTPYSGLSRADLILVSHAHTDHYDAATLSAVKGAGAVILAPSAVYQAMPTALKSLTTVLANGDQTNVLGIKVEAVPMYNLTSGRLQYHVKGQGNGYVLTIGGKRIYLSGDTEDTPEMRALTNLDVAFICMNLPYTMSVQQASAVVRVIRPRVVYPYHYSGSNVGPFKTQVGTDLGIEVRLRKWY